MEVSVFLISDTSRPPDFTASPEIFNLLEADKKKFNCTRIPIDGDILSAFFSALWKAQSLVTPFLILFDSVVTALPTDVLHETLCQSFDQSTKFDILYLIRWQDRCDWLSPAPFLSENFFQTKHAHGDQAFLITPRGRDILLANSPVVRVVSPVPIEKREIPTPTEKLISKFGKFLRRSAQKVIPPVSTVPNVEELDLTTINDPIDPLRGGVIENRNGAPQPTAITTLDAFLHNLIEKNTLVALVYKTPLMSYNTTHASSLDDYFRTHECLRPAVRTLSKAARRALALKAAARGMSLGVLLALIILLILVVIILGVFLYLSRKSQYKNENKNSSLTKT